MQSFFSSDLVLGIISGGQLGKMLIQEASKWDITTYVLDEDPTGPTSGIATKFFQGSRFDFDAVYDFGKKVDILTFEIESINVNALYRLKTEGLKIVPDPSILELFQDKAKQKDFYALHNLPTAKYKIYNEKNEIVLDINSGKLTLPFVQKLTTGGYDGRGVAVIDTPTDINDLLDGKSIIEEKIDIFKEIAIIVARNESGEIKSFPAVEMEFEHNANLVKRLICPANITKEQEQKAIEISHKLISDLNMCGLLAIEMFIDSRGNILINESAPRTHNSGHHTIESVMTSQFEQHLRAILNLPLGSTEIIMPSIMLNLLGEPGYTGKVKYDGLSECLALEGVYVHLYGKKITKPYRKMGHITIIDKDINNLSKKEEFIRNHLKCRSSINA